MKVKVCPKCGKHNPEDAWSCTDCGETLSLKTLMETESKQFLNITPIAGLTTLSEISAYFEQDVIGTLRTHVRIDDSILWGCNYTEVLKTPSYIFGYMILTSQKLILVQFVSDTKRKHVSSGLHFLLNPLTYFVKELFGVYEESTHPWEDLSLFKVPYPSQHLTPTEENSRRVIALEIKNLTSVRLISSWSEGNIINSVVVGFGSDNLFTITFYSPHAAEKAHQLLIAQIDESST